MKFFRTILYNVQCTYVVHTIVHVHCTYSVQSSVADAQCFYADPDPTFRADAVLDPDPNLLVRERKKFFKIFYFLKSYKTCLR